MYRLMVSADCGVNYYPEAEASSVEELLPKIEKLGRLRWVIEDEKGEVVDIAELPKTVLAVLATKHTAVERALYHHHDVSPVMVTMILGKKFAEAPPLPTEDEKEQTTEIVEELLQRYKSVMREAVLEVTGEVIDEW